MGQGREEAGKGGTREGGGRGEGARGEGAGGAGTRGGGGGREAGTRGEGGRGAGRRGKGRGAQVNGGLIARIEEYWPLAASGLLPPVLVAHKIALTELIDVLWGRPLHQSQAKLRPDLLECAARLKCTGADSVTSRRARAQVALTNITRL